MQTRQTWLRPNWHWRLLALAIVMIVSAFLVVTAPKAHAGTTTPGTMNFQGRLTNASGTVLPDGNYNMTFRVFTVASGGSASWSEVHANSSSTGVALKNGVFSVQLGIVSGFTTSMFTNPDLYFEIELPSPATATCTGVGCASYTEGPMTPRSKLANSAYAFNSERLDGLDSSDFAQLAVANTFSGSILLKANIANEFQVTKSNNTNIFAVDSSSNNLVTVGSTTTDAVAILFEVDSYNNGTDPTGSNGDIYYNSNLNAFRCKQNGSWVNCIGAGSSPTLQNAYDNSSSPATITTSSGTKGVLVKAGATFDQTDLFDIQNAAGNEVFSADTTNSRIQIGDTVADSTGTVLVLDTKNSAGDPTGVDGAMYFNSNMEEYRCYRDTNWEPCGTKPIDRAYVVDEEFISGLATATGTGYGNYNWINTSLTAGACTAFSYSGGLGGTAVSADRPGILKFSTAATISAGCRMTLGPNATGQMFLGAGLDMKFSAAIGSVGASTAVMRIGADTGTTATTQAVNSGVWWEADTTASTTNWRYCFATGTVATCASGGALAAGTFARLEIRINAIGVGTSNVDFIMNGTTYNVSGVTVAAGIASKPDILCYAAVATAENCYIDYYYMRRDTSAAR